MGIDFAVWIAVCAAKVIGLLLAGRQSCAREIRFLRYYFALGLLCEVGLFGAIRHYGLRSSQYSFAYYASDIGLTVAGYFVLARLLEVAFARTGKASTLRNIALWLFVGVATCSAYVVFQVSGSFASRWCLELEQNFSFVGMLLAVALFVILNIVRMRGVRFRRVVLWFSVLFSSNAIAFTMMSLFPGSHLVRLAVPMTSLGSWILLLYGLAVPDPEPLPAPRPAFETAPFAPQGSALALPYLPAAIATRSGLAHSTLILVGSSIALVYSLFAFVHARILDADIGELERLHREGLLIPNAGVVEDFRAIQKRLDEIAPGLYMRQEAWLRVYYYLLRALRAGENRVASLDRELVRLSAYQAARFRDVLTLLDTLKHEA